MEKEPRKASDVLLELEKKMDLALSIIRTQDMSIKILSNKLNSVLEALQKQTVAPPKITVEAVNTFRPQPTVFPDYDKQVPVAAESKLPVDNTPQGFRRTSRPETFAGDNAFTNPVKPTSVEPKFPVQVPKAPPGRGPQAPSPPPGREAEVMLPVSPKKVGTTNKATADMAQNTIPVMQRVVNSQGKSLFLADVEITDTSTLEMVTKTRTNGAGKWMASLAVGDYRVVVRKLEPSNKQKMEAVQNIHVDGTASRLDLETVIIK